MNIKWNDYFMGMIDNVSMKSKDKYTKVGAIITGSDHEIRSTGFNSFVRGMNDDIPERQERPEKYWWIEHAERNAIYNAARQGISTNGSTLVCVWAACSDCARAIIQSGISELITINTNDDEADQRWKESNQFGLEMLNEVGIKIVKLDSVYGNLTPILRNGVKWLPPST